MFSLWKKGRNDERLALQYVDLVLVIGREVCPSVAKGVEMVTQGEVVFPVDDDVQLQISLAILGTSLAILRGHSQLMSPQRGARIDEFCRAALVDALEGPEQGTLPDHLAQKLLWLLDQYREAFDAATSSKENPFGCIAGLMLLLCLGPDVEAVCLPRAVAGEDGIINPLVQETTGDAMTITVTNALKFWKGK